jgi:TPR repeat protein
MKTSRFFVVVLWLLAFAAPVWGDDLAAFVDSLKTRAAQGEAKAQTILAILYYEGRGVPQDYTEALKWYRLAAAQGEALAQYHLGLMYAKGYGVPQDHSEAHTWFTLAAASSTSKPNRDRAVAARDAEAARMTPAQIAEAQKRAREWKKQ